MITEGTATNHVTHILNKLAYAPGRTVWASASRERGTPDTLAALPGPPECEPPAAPDMRFFRWRRGRRRVACAHPFQERQRMMTTW